MTRTVPSRRRRANEALQLQLFAGAEPPAAVEPEPEPAAAASAPVPEPVTQRPAAAPPVSKAELDEWMDQALGTPAAEFRDRLRALLPGRLGTITLTDNRSTIVSAREDGKGRLDVRIQNCFAEAADETLAAIATFLTSDKGSSARRHALAEIREHFAGHGPRPVVRRRRRIVLRPVGNNLDLREVRDELNRKYFGGEIEVHVTWGRAPSRRRRARGKRNTFSVRLGTYNDRDRVVSIHRCLDRVDVPRYVVASVVYHEMLHAAMPPVVEGGRRRVHTPEFRRRERQFPGYRRAERWLDRNLKRLI